MAITAVIPALNEGPRIAATLAGIRPYVDEMIVVDDASTDTTADEAARAGARVLRRTVRGGYIAAVKQGIAQAADGIVVLIDADGETSPEYIPALVAPIRAGAADMVQGARPHIPRPSERFLNGLANLAAPVGDSGTGLRAMRTDLARSLGIPGACICGILTLEAVCQGARIVDVPIALETIDKPRRIAWFHARQLLLLVPWVFRAAFRRRRTAAKRGDSLAPPFREG